MISTDNNKALVPLDVALSALHNKTIPILAGGTDFYPALADKAAPTTVLDITKIDGLRGISTVNNVWKIGAATTWSDLIRAELPAMFDGLKQAAREIGSIQIQNNATLVGNLCNASPAADGVPVLLALNASVEIANSVETRSVRLDQFILGPRHTVLAPGDLVVAITIPDISARVRSAFQKLGSRRYLVISIVMVSVILIIDEDDKITDARIAVGACSAVATRLKTLENALLGESIQSDLLSFVSTHAFSGLSPIDDIRGSRDYRLVSAQELVKRLLQNVIDQFADAASDSGKPVTGS